MTTMTRINALRHIAKTGDSVAWGKQSNFFSKNVALASMGNLNALAFAAVLIVCSFAVGCSSEQPKPAISNNQIPITQSPSMNAPTPTPALTAENKPAPKKIVHKKPATVSYTDKTYGVTFEYPRRYGIETGDAASELVQSNPLPMNFVQPGGVALAAVELPETSFANTDFSSAFFNVSVHKSLNADQCVEFAVPAPKSTPAPAQPVIAGNSAPSTESVPASSASTETAKSAVPESQPAAQPTTPVVTADAPITPAAEPQGSKLLLGDMELRGTEAVAGEGTRQSDSKYFHIYQNGSCYEFALNVTTVASQDGLIKHVNRDQVFDRLEKILATVKINPVAAPETTAEAPAAPAPSGTPAQ
jgi:hypothetical protein